MSATALESPSERRADVRFLLPRASGHALVLGNLPDWEDDLSHHGWSTSTARPAGRYDLVIADAAHVDEACASRADCVVILGDTRRSKRSAGHESDVYVQRSSSVGPSLFVPLRHREITTYVWRRWLRPPQRWRRLRNHMLPIVLPHLPRRSTVTVARPPGSAPFFIAEARRLGVPDDARWFLALGDGDALQRGVFHIFECGATRPTWALKFSRVPGNVAPFDADQRGIALLAHHAPRCASAAPRVIGRIEVDQLFASLETAAVGEPLSQLLVSNATRRTKRNTIDATARWLVDLAAESRSNPADLSRELRRLEEDVIPRWHHEPGAGRLLASLPPLPGVLLHADPGPWNVVADRDRVTILDWESARYPGLPLWDLVYFLTDALVSAEGVIDESEKQEMALRLFKGELLSSEVLFRWVREAVARLELPARCVGSVLALCWMHHGLSPKHRLTRLPGDSRPTAQTSHLARLADAWLTDPLLGESWDLWQQR